MTRNRKATSSRYANTQAEGGRNQVENDALGISRNERIKTNKNDFNITNKDFLFSRETNVNIMRVERECLCLCSV